MGNLVSQIAKIKQKREVIIVTSGAIGAGMQELKLKKVKDVIMKQVCAAVGQNILMSTYKSLFDKHNIKIAQILLKYDDIADKETYKNLRNSMEKLLELGVIPIINENDPISINEISTSFGDNDNLSALIATKIKADLLIALTNVDGLYNKNPADKNALLIKEVKNIDKRIESMVGKSASLGIGGMKAKIEYLKKATREGVIVVIANGRANNVLINVLNNEAIGTIIYGEF